jgi:hypothetical protein
MRYTEDSPLYQLLATRYAPEREDEAIEILNEHPEIARLEWPWPDSNGQPFVKGSTATPLGVALESRNTAAIEFLHSIGASEI